MELLATLSQKTMRPMSKLLLAGIYCTGLAMLGAVEEFNSNPAVSYEGQDGATPPDTDHVQVLQEKFATGCRNNDIRMQNEAESELTITADGLDWNITMQECIAGVPFTIGPLYLPFL